MSELIFKKTDTLDPDPLTPNTLYFHNDGNSNILTIMMTDKEGARLTRGLTTGQMAGLVEDHLNKFVMLDGPQSLYQGESGTYTITNYDLAHSYSLTTTNGTVTRTGSVVTYTPEVAGVSGFTISGREAVITCLATVPAAPSVVTPVLNSLNVGAEVTITSSAFSTVGGVDTHASTNWQLATDAEFMHIVKSNLNNSVDKTSWTVSDLNPSQTYYVRVQYRGVVAGVYGAWSAISHFTTKSAFVPTGELAKLIDSSGAVNDYMGYCTAISKNGLVAVVGVYADDDAATNSGSVLVYKKVNGLWGFHTKLHASDPSASDYFGFSLAINWDGSTIAVGAHNRLSGTGAVYVYIDTGTSIVEQARLVAATAVAGDGFGYSLGLDGTGDTLVVGSHHHNQTGVQSGAAYVFARSVGTWTEHSLLVGTDTAASDLYGQSVCISTNGLVIGVGAPSHAGKGAAYIHTQVAGVWSSGQKLLADDGVTLDNFGYSLSMSGVGDRVFVGAYKAVGAQYDTGAVYVFDLVSGTYAQTAKIVSSASYSGDWFGSSLANNDIGNMVVVGAQYNDDIDLSSGGAYVFTEIEGTWSQVRFLTASDAASMDRYGCSVSVCANGTTALVGAVGKTSNTGALYIVG